MKKLVTTKEFEELNAEFSTWFDTTKSIQSLYGRGICKGIVMEFLANKQDKTIYTHIAEAD